jgi:hypothetical protein
MKGEYVVRPPGTPHEVHIEGGEFRLDIVDSTAPVNERRWRIILKNGVFQLVLINDAGSEHRVLHIQRQGTGFDVTRGGAPL